MLDSIRVRLSRGKVDAIFGNLLKHYGLYPSSVQAEVTLQKVLQNDITPFFLKKLLIYSWILNEKESRTTLE